MGQGSLVLVEGEWALRVLVAGGVFRLSPEERAARQPAPEVLLVDGLRACGVDAVECPLEDIRTPTLDRSFDVVHVHHLSKAALAACLSPLSRPMVFTEHGMPASPSRAMQLARRFIFHRADGVVCLSENERALKTLQFNLAPSSTRVIPNPASLASCTPFLRSPPAGRFRLLFVGQLIPLKQVDRIVQALPTLPRGVTVRVVFHNDEMLPDLRRQAARLGVGDRIEFAGQLSGEVLRDAYMEADALVLPSAHEALPSVVSEALLTGLPVIASEVGGIPEQIGNAGILVSPLESDPLGPAIQQMMARYEEYASAAYARSTELAAELSPQASVEAHIALYERLLETQ